jgi:hypothetical protein
VASERMAAMRFDMKKAGAIYLAPASAFFSIQAAIGS